MIMLRHMVPLAPRRRPQHAFLGLAPRVRLPPSRWQASDSSKIRDVDVGTQAGETGSLGRSWGHRLQLALPRVASRHNPEDGGVHRTLWAVLEARRPPRTRVHPPRGALSTFVKGSKGRVGGEAGVWVPHPEEEKSLRLSLPSCRQPGRGERK